MSEKAPHKNSSAIDFSSFIGSQAPSLALSKVPTTSSIYRTVQIDFHKLLDPFFELSFFCVD